MPKTPVPQCTEIELSPEQAERLTKAIGKAKRGSETCLRLTKDLREEARSLREGGGALRTSWDLPPAGA